MKIVFCFLVLVVIGTLIMNTVHRAGFQKGRDIGELTWNQLTVEQQREYRLMIEDPLHMILPPPLVEFLALREGICRSIWVEGKTILSSKIIECPTEELSTYIK